MTEFRLTQIPLAVPEKGTEFHSRSVAAVEINNHIRGFNEAIDQISNKVFVVDVETLAKTLHESRHTIFTKMFPWENLKDHDKEEYKREARAIAQHIPEIIKVKE